MSELPPLRLATRGSRQALGQSGAVAAAITAATGRAVDLVTIETTGDVRLDVPLHQIGGQGVFVKEVQRAVLDGRADLAVHSAKDLPSTPADGLRIAAFCERRDPRDALVGSDLASLAEGCTVATGSVRRRAQLRRVRPDLDFAELRGNIDSRLSKVPDGGAIVMAVAALDILGLTDRIAEMLDVDEFVPAVGQGCVAVECRADDGSTLEVQSAVDHPRTRHSVDHLRRNERFVALHVDDRIAIHPRSHFRNAVGASGVIRARHFHRAKFCRHFRDAFIVRGHNHIRQRRRLTTALHHVLNQRLTRNKMQRLAWKPRGSVPRGNDADGFHRQLI